MGGGDIGDSDRSTGEMINDPVFQPPSEHLEKLVVADVGSTRTDHAGDEDEEGVARSLDLRCGHPPDAPVQAHDEAVEEVGQRVLSRVQEQATGCTAPPS